MRRSTLHKCRVPGGSGGPATRRSFMDVYVLLRRGRRSAPYLHRLGNEPCPLQGRAPWPPRPRCREIRSSSWTAGIVQSLVPSPSAHTRSQKERGYPRRDTAVGLKGCKARLCPQDPNVEASRALGGSFCTAIADGLKRPTWELWQLGGAPVQGEEEGGHCRVLGRRAVEAGEVQGRFEPGAGDGLGVGELP